MSKSYQEEPSMILDHQEQKRRMPTRGVNTRNGLKKLQSISNGSSAQEKDQQRLNETVENSIRGASDFRNPSKKYHQSLNSEDGDASQDATAAEVRTNSAKSSKKRKIEEISNEDTNAQSPSQQRKKMLKLSPTNEELVTKEEFVSLPSLFLKSSSSQDVCVVPHNFLNLDILKSALTQKSTQGDIVIASSSCDYQVINPDAQLQDDKDEGTYIINIENPEIAPLKIEETGPGHEELSEESTFLINIEKPKIISLQIEESGAEPEEQSVVSNIDSPFDQPLGTQYSVDSPSVTDVVAPTESDSAPEEVLPSSIDGEVLQATDKEVPESNNVA